MSLTSYRAAPPRGVACDIYVVSKQSHELVGLLVYCCRKYTVKPAASW